MSNGSLRLSILVFVVISGLHATVLWSPPPGPPAVPGAVPPVLHIPRPTIADIQHRGVLTVLMHHDAASYFLYRGKEQGFEYELARGFAQQLGVTLQVRTPPPGVPLTQWLIEGKGDIAAGVLFAYGRPSALVRYSHAYSVPPYPSTLPDTGLEKAPPSLRRVRLDSGFSGLTLSVAMKKPAPFVPLPTPVLGWAVRREQAELLAAVNQYHAQTKRSGLRKILYEKYFTTLRFLRSDESTLFSGRLSQYDSLIARYAEPAGFDWRLIAALIFEESRFDHTRRSSRGAQGLMQVMPIAASEVGVRNFRTLQGNLEAGVKYLRFVLTQFPNGQPQDRLAFALSGYLLGPSRVRAVQRLALVLGYDPHCWKDSVEAVFPLLEDAEYYRRVNTHFIPGGKAVQYVNTILRRYELYTRYIPRVPTAPALPS